MVRVNVFRRAGVLALGVALLVGSSAQAQLRVVSWNVSNYSGGRVADIQTTVYGVYQTRSMAPDIILAQEFLSSAAQTAFLNALNTASGSPGDWAAAPWLTGPDTISVCFYRTSSVSLLESVIISVGGGTPAPPRSTPRYKFRVSGYTTNKAVLYCYNSHMKAGTAAEDEARRLVEAQRIRDNAQVLDPNCSFLVVGDFNIYTSTEDPYIELVGSQADNSGRFFDPIKSPGNWHDGSSFRFIHTQDPVSTNGGMDDRFDQILVSDNLIDGDGLDYIGNPAIAYSTTTWNDVNHSYRAWGNDGTSLNAGLTVTGNTMVGPTIAQAIINVATTAGGHIPVFLDLRVPAVVNSDTVIDFGQIAQNAPATRSLNVWNDGNVTLWTAAGIDNLDYTLNASTGFTAPGGTFVNAAGSTHDQHTITMDTTTVGPKSGTVTILSNAADQPSRLVTLLGEVTGGQTWQPGDMNCDGVVSYADINPFVLALSGQAGYEAQYPSCDFMNADCNNDGVVSYADINPFVQLLSGK
jgi:endonuclease/exonuclease/phosphatase family metal-dependent hydrolase